MPAACNVGHPRERILLLVLYKHNKIWNRHKDGTVAQKVPACSCANEIASMPVSNAKFWDSGIS